MKKINRSAKFRKSVIAALVVIVCAGVVANRVANSGRDKTPPKKVALVVVMPVQRGSIARTIETTGTVEAENTVAIVPKLEQRIVWMPFREGDSVRRGQVVVRLDDSESADQLAAAEAEVSVAEARLRDVLAGSRSQEISAARAVLEQAEVNARQARQDLQHVRKLYAEDGIPEQQLEEARSRYDTAVANVESAKAALQDAQTELDRQTKMLKVGGVSREDVDRAQTRRDIARSALSSASSALRAAKSNLAHVEELNVRVIPIQKLDEAEARYASALSAVEAAKARLDLLKEGASPTQVGVAREQLRQARLKAGILKTQASYAVITSPVDGIVTDVRLAVGDMAQPRQPILFVAENGRTLVRTALTDREATRVKPGQPALASAGGKTLQLRVSRIYPAADASTRLIPVELALAGRDRRPLGSFVSVRLVTEKRENVVVVPSDAVLRRPGGKTVAFVVEKGVARARLLAKGIEAGGRVEILSGLKPGEMLVIRGQEILKDGAEVRVKQPRRSAGAGSRTKGGAQ